VEEEKNKRWEIFEIQGKGGPVKRKEQPTSLFCSV
jgi:hypothetical protein